MWWDDKPKQKIPPQTTTYLPTASIPTNPETLKWGIVSTIKAPIGAVAQFAAWHLDAGADHIHIHLDVPDEGLANRLAHPKIRFTQCTNGYWENAPEKSRQTHQMRQAYNASRSYQNSHLDWLMHIDVDEFLLSYMPLSNHLAQAQPDSAFVRLHPVEMMARVDSAPRQSTYFKRTRKHVKQPKSILETIYPTYGAHVPEGFISYSGGKNMVRTGIPDVRLGIHATLHKGLKLSNGASTIDIAIGHAHAPTWDKFKRHLEFRMAKGSYRQRKSNNNQLSNILQLISQENDGKELRAFFNEMCLATPERLDLLRAHGMLLEWRMDLNEKVERHFGKLEEQE